MEVLLIGAAAAAVAGFAYLVWLGFGYGSDELVRERLQNKPRTLIGEARGGRVVRLSGTVSLREPLSAPVSGRPCAAWRVRVEEYGPDRGWFTVLETEEATDFTLTDATGKAAVRARGARMLLDMDVSDFAERTEPPPEALQPLMPDAWTMRLRRYHEAAVEVGERIVVGGVGFWEPDPEAAVESAGYRVASRPQRLAVRQPSSGPLIISDEPALSESAVAESAEESAVEESAVAESAG